ncbi:MAG: GGDEF domain-containing protein [Lachnospiraceae bacterium]|nr:GGDEF domain-containing protein [Lachnospiraceae bacterium]
MKWSRDGRWNRFLEKSLEYIRNNPEYVAIANQDMLRKLNLMYPVLLLSYGLISRFDGAGTMVMGFYLAAVVIQLLLAGIVYQWSKKHHSVNVVNVVCGTFQLYVLFSVTVFGCLSPANKWPASFFAPAIMAFSILFIYSWYTMSILLAVESVQFMLISYRYKQFAVFSNDVYGCLLTVVLVIFCARVLMAMRIRENQSLSHLEEMSALDKLTGLHNKASAEFLCRSYIDHTSNPSGALLVIDFDNFKNVNDTLGHLQGIGY